MMQNMRKHCNDKTVKPEAIEILLEQAVRDICVSRGRGIRENNPTEYLKHCLRYEWLRYTVKRKASEEFNAMWDKHVKAKELAYQEDGRVKAGIRTTKELGKPQLSSSCL